MHWQNLSGDIAPKVHFCSKKWNYSKSNEFARKKSITNYDSFWHQKLLNIIFMSNTHFDFFENWITCPFLPKCRPPIVRRKVKKFSISIWFILETFRLQKVGVAAGFWVHKVASDFDFGHFSENLIYWRFTERFFPPKGDH